MSDLTHVKIIGVADKAVELEIAQIHPDSALNVKLSDQALKSTALILLVDLLGRCGRRGKQQPHLLKQFQDIPNLITAVAPSTAWDDGYFNGMGSNEIRQAEHWSHIPKMRFKITFRDQTALEGIKTGLKADTSLDTHVLEWA